MVYYVGFMTWRAEGITWNVILLFFSCKTESKFSLVLSLVFNVLHLVTMPYFVFLFDYPIKDFIGNMLRLFCFSFSCYSAPGFFVSFYLFSFENTFFFLKYLLEMGIEFNFSWSHY